jgi:hypothetical protein
MTSVQACGDVEMVAAACLDMGCTALAGQVIS